MFALAKLPDGVTAAATPLQPPPPPPMPPPSTPQFFAFTGTRTPSREDETPPVWTSSGHEDDGVDIGCGGDDDDDGSSGGLSDLNEDLLDRDDRRDINGAVCSYLHMRNIISKEKYSNGFQLLKPVLEYVNIKYVEDNFRSIGISKRFPKNNLFEAILEVEAMENWCSSKKCSISGKEYVRNLCIPLFCHLYMSIYNQNSHKEMISFLKRFIHLFSGSVGLKLIEELESFTGFNNLPPILNVLRKNKLIYSCSPQFLTSFSKMLHQNYMLKAVFQEFFEIQFHTCENPFEVVDCYFVINMRKIKNKLIVNDKEFTSFHQLRNIEPNISQNNDHSINGTTNNNNDQRPSTSKDYQKCNNQEPQPNNNQLKGTREISLSDSENEKPQKKYRLIEKPEVHKNNDDQRPSTSKDYQNCNSQEPQPNNNQTKGIKEILSSSDSENKKPRRKHRIIENPKVNKSLNDQQPSTSREFPNYHNLESKKSNQQPTIINMSLSDSDSETPQRNQLVEQNESNKIIDEQCLSTSREIQNYHHQKPQSSKEQAKVSFVDILSSDSDSEKSRKHSQPVKNRELDQDLDDQLPSTSREHQNYHEEPQLNKKLPKVINVLSSDSENELHKKKIQLVKPNFESQDQSKVTKVILLSSDSENEKKVSTQRKHRRSKKFKVDKKNEVKRKHSSDEKNRSSSLEKESENKKKQRKEEFDLLNVQNGSTSNQENKKSVDKENNEQDNEHQQSQHEKINKSEKKALNNENIPLTQQCECNLKDGKKLNFPIKSSFEDSSEDSSGDSYCSQYSLYDEEATLRSYFREQNKSIEYLQSKTSRLMKHINVTKIDVENIDEDLCATRQITITNCYKLSCTMLSSDHKHVAAGSTDSIIYVWERSNLSYVTEVQNNIANNTHTISPNKNIIEFLDKSEAKVLRGHGGSIYDLAEVATAKILLSASHDKTFRAWDLKTKICLEVYDEHEHRTWCIAASPFTLQVITGTCEGASCLWFLKYKRPLRFFIGHIDDVLVVKFHPNQVLVATGSSDKTIRIFEVTSGECTRLLIGHNDYVTCLEFHPTQSNFLASASGSGEIFLWNTGKSTIIWKLRVNNISISDLAWFTEKIILASLTSGIILKCDTREDYMESSKSVKGYRTKFDRLMALKIHDSIVYTIGVPKKPIVQKTSSVKHPAKIINQMETDSQHQAQKSPKEVSSPTKLLYPQPVFENNSNSIRPSNRSNSSIINTSTGFVKMDLQPSSFQLSSDSPSNNLRVIHSPSNKSTPSLTLLKNNFVSNNQNDVQGPNPNSSQINVQLKTAKSMLQNVHSSSINLPQQTHGTLQSQTTNAQHTLSKNNSMMNSNFQNLHLQNNINITNPKHHQNQKRISQLPTVIQPRIPTQLLQKNGLQPEQQLHLQQSVGSNFQLTNTNIIQQPVFQQLRPNTLLTKVNIQQLKSQQPTSIRLANMSSPQSFSENVPRTVPQVLTIRPQKSKTSQPSLENLEEDARLRQVVMASLLENNPEMFSRGQTVIGEITRSQSTTQS